MALFGCSMLLKLLSSVSRRCASKIAMLAGADFGDYDR
jgi:hypothetical protein